MKYAGFWWRFLAILIDGIVTSIMAAIAAFIAAKLMPVGEVEPDGKNLKPLGLILVNYVSSTLISWAYFTLFESSHNMATPGKLICKIVVTDEQGQRLGFGRANARYWSKVLSAFSLGIGYIMVAFTEKKQGLHDIIARTLVVKKSSLTLQQTPITQPEIVL